METEEQLGKTKDKNLICQVCKGERNTLYKLEWHIENH